MDTPPAPPERDRDATLAAFRDEARAILALSGGLNALSMGKVRHRGRELGLSDAEVDAVVAAARGASTPATSPEAEAFRRELGAIFQKAKLRAGGLLNPRLAERIEAHGQAKYGLGESQAADLVREAARERGIKRLSAEGAESAVRQQAAAMAAAGITPAKRRAFGKFATSMGVRAARAAEILAEESRTAVVHPDRVRAENSRFLWGLIGGAALALLMALLGIDFVRRNGLPRWNSPGPSVPATPPAAASASKPAGPAEPDAVGLALADARAVLDAPADAAILDKLGSADEAERLGALRSLEIRLPSRLREDARRDRLARLLAALYARDPADALAGEVRSLVDGRLGAVADAEAESPEVFGQAFWALDLALEALRVPGIDPDRARPLAAAVLQAVGADPGEAEALVATLAGEARAADARAAALRAQLATFAYRALTDRAATQGGFGNLAAWRDALAGPASAALPPDRRVRLDAEFLAVAIESPGADFRNYLGLLRDVLNANEPEAVGRVLDLYRRTGNVALRDAIEAELRQRLGPDAPDEPDALADAYRKDLKPAGGRAEQFRQAAEAALAMQARASGGPGETLVQALNLARASALGCALATGDAGSARFDELMKAPIDDKAGAAAGPSLNTNASANADPNAGRIANRGVPAMQAMPPVGFPTFGGRGRGMPAFQAAGQAPPGRRGPTFGGGIPTPDALIRQIAGGTPFDRMNAWRLIGQVGLPDDLPPHEARALARYVLWGGKPPDEFGITMSGLTAVVEPRAVRVAMADYLGEVVPLPRRFDLLDPPMLARVVETITGRPPRLSKLHYRDDARRMLVADVLQDLEPDLDALAGRYRELYRAQGLLLGMSDGDALLTARPSQMIEVVTNHLIGRLESNRAGLSESDRARLALLPHEVVAADYASGGDELARAVLVQRVWLKALALEVASRQPALADQAWALASEVAPEEAEAREVLAQLRAGEARALRLWMLLAPADARRAN
jgi:hypothetical protein